MHIDFFFVHYLVCPHDDNKTEQQQTIGDCEGQPKFCLNGMVKPTENYCCHLMNGNSFHWQAVVIAVDF